MPVQENNKQTMRKKYLTHFKLMSNSSKWLTLTLLFLSYRNTCNIYSIRTGRCSSNALDSRSVRISVGTPSIMTGGSAFCGFALSIQVSSWVVLQLVHDRFLPNNFWSIASMSSYHSTLYSTANGSAVKYQTKNLLRKRIGQIWKEQGSRSCA
jgi:hypothetical protein